MLYVFHGNNRKKVADQAYALTNSLLQKRPNAQLFTFEGTDLPSGAVDGLIEAQGLFVERHIVTLKEPLQENESRAFVTERLERFAKTQNIFIIIENTLHASHKKQLTQYAEKIEEHTEVSRDKKTFNVFALSDELGVRNKRELWMLYIQALKKGVEAESIHGTLHWAVRGMLFALLNDSAEKAGQKPFMYSKFRRYAKNYGREDLKNLSRELIDIYHNARRGKCDLKVALEYWILSL